MAPSDPGGSLWWVYWWSFPTLNQGWSEWPTGKAVIKIHWSFCLVLRLFTLEETSGKSSNKWWSQGSKPTSVKRPIWSGTEACHVSTNLSAWWSSDLRSESLNHSQAFRWYDYSSKRHLSITSWTTLSQNCSKPLPNIWLTETISNNKWFTLYWAKKLWNNLLCRNR